MSRCRRTKVVVERLHARLPVGKTVDFVEEDVCSAVGPVPLDGLLERMIGEPDVLNGGEENLVPVGKGLLDALEEHRRLAGAARSADADQAVVPVDAPVQITVEARFDRFQTAVESTAEPVGVFMFHGSPLRLVERDKQWMKTCFLSTKK